MELLALEGHQPGRVYALGARSVTFGRSPSSDVVLDDDDVSREHCRIRPADDGYVIEDLRSRNGTIVNGRRIEGPIALRPGDLVVVGRTLFEVRGGQGPAASARPRRQSAPAAPRAAALGAPPAAPSPAAPTDLAATAAAAAVAGERVRRRVAALAARLERTDRVAGDLAAILERAARAGGPSEAQRLLVVCRLAAAERRDQRLVDLLGTEVGALHRVIGVALALCETVRAS